MAKAKKKPGVSKKKKIEKVKEIKTEIEKAESAEETTPVNAGVFTGFFEFLKRYSVIGLAIGLVIGNQSQNLVKVIVDGFITPFLGLFLPKSDSLKNLTFKLRGEEFKYGALLQTTIEFIVILFIIYFVIKILLKREDLIEDKKKKKEEK
jgi:large conductance mechanosensitive channel